MAGEIFTIGHSNHPLELFLELLKRHGIEAVGDTRSYPRSKFTPHYDREALQSTLPAHGIRYLFLGKELGGRPDGAHFYDPDGHVLYGRVAEAEFFQRGLERLEQERNQSRLALLCSEEDPNVCHRRLLIARVLRERGIPVAHIRAGGQIETEDEIVAREALEAAADPQLALFDHSPIPEWKSIPSVLPKRPQNDSSAS
jgi:uncharacterized protein (DUF488 family)